VTFAGCYEHDNEPSGPTIETWNVLTSRASVRIWGIVLPVDSCESTGRRLTEDSAAVGELSHLVCKWKLIYIKIRHYMLIAFCMQSYRHAWRELRPRPADRLWPLNKVNMGLVLTVIINQLLLLLLLLLAQGLQWWPQKSFDSNVGTKVLTAVVMVVLFSEI
jgi:hypothetical protein